MSKLPRALISIEFAVSFGVPYFLWLWGMYVVLATDSLFDLSSVGSIRLPVFLIPAVFGAAGAWGVLALYLNAVFGYKAFGDLKYPVFCGALGVFALLFVEVFFNELLTNIFKPYYSPLINILPIGCFAHLAWLNNKPLVSNGT